MAPITRPRPAAFLLLLLTLLVTLVAATPLDNFRPQIEDFRLSKRDSDEGTKTDDRCSYTSQCPTCTSVDAEDQIQCCWPYGKGYGSAFDAPGFCICAPPRLYDYDQCNGGYWTS